MSGRRLFGWSLVAGFFMALSNYLYAFLGGA